MGVLDSNKSFEGLILGKQTVHWVILQNQNLVVAHPISTCRVFLCICVYEVEVGAGLDGERMMTK